MQIQPVSAPAIAAPSPSPVAAPATADAVAVPVTDSVTLSAGAQALLDAGAAAAGGGWATDAVKQALAALNDASGVTAVGDQMAAYKTISTMIGAGEDLDTADKRAAAASVITAYLDSPFAKRVQAVHDHVQDRFEGNSKGLTPESAQAALDAFNGLPEDDQQIYVAAENFHSDYATKVRTGDAYASPDAFRANLTAQLGIARELRTTMADPFYVQKIKEELARIPQPGETVSGDPDRRAVARAAAEAGDQRVVDLMALTDGGQGDDAWTAQAEAHFATFGPPPTTSPRDSETLWGWPSREAGYTPPSNADLAKALVLLNDNSAGAPLREQAKAYGIVDDYIMKSGDFGPARAMIEKNLEKSGIFQKIWSAESRMWDAQMSQQDEIGRRAENDEAFSNEDYYLKALNTLSLEDQDFVYVANDRQGWTEFDDVNIAGKRKPYSSLEDFKATLQSKAEAAAPVNLRITKAKQAARAEGGYDPQNPDEFTLKWMSKLSVEDQTFVWHGANNGMHAVGPDDWHFTMGYDATLDEYKKDLTEGTRKMAALLSRLSPANGKADGKTDGKAAAKPAAQHPHGDPSVTVTPAGQIGASIALKVLQRAVEAQKAADEQARAQAAQRDAAGLRGRAERG